MESINISKLNLSSVNNDLPQNRNSDKSSFELGREVQDQLDEDNYFCEYRQEIWKHLLEKENENPRIQLRSPQLEFRGALVQKLREISHKLKLGTATLHVAVTLLDLFMDSHQLRDDRLTDVALACLSLAAKIEERFNRAPNLKTLSKASGVHLSASIFRQLEWMVGQHVRWRLLMPTAVTFASLLGNFLVTREDLSNRHPKFMQRFKTDGKRLLDSYLDLTLSDVRLKAVECVEVGCACVACARADLGLVGWPGWLADLTSTAANKVAPIARLLHRMMQVMKAKETPATEDDQGYSSARTSPNLTPCASPASTRYQVSPSSSCSSNSRHAMYRNQDIPDSMKTSDKREICNYYNNVAKTHQNCDLEDTANIVDNSEVHMKDAHDLITRNDLVEYQFNKSRKYLEECVNEYPKQAVKRSIGVDGSVDLGRKRLRIANDVAMGV